MTSMINAAPPRMSTAKAVSAGGWASVGSGDVEFRVKAGGGEPGGGEPGGGDKDPFVCCALAFVCCALTFVCCCALTFVCCVCTFVCCCALTPTVGGCKKMNLSFTRTAAPVTLSRLSGTTALAGCSARVLAETSEAAVGRRNRMAIEDGRERAAII